MAEPEVVDLALRGVLEKPSVSDPGFMKFRRGHWNDEPEARRVVENAIQALEAAGYVISIPADWEYAMRDHWHGRVGGEHPAWADPKFQEAARRAGHAIVRRRAAGPWETVEESADAPRSES